MFDNILNHVYVHLGGYHGCSGVGGRVWFVFLLARRGKNRPGSGSGSRSPPSRGKV
jgi:hypothetical protein